MHPLMATTTFPIGDIGIVVFSVRNCTVVERSLVTVLPDTPWYLLVSCRKANRSCCFPESIDNSEAEKETSGVFDSHGKFHRSFLSISRFLVLVSPTLALAENPTKSSIQGRGGGRTWDMGHQMRWSWELGLDRRSCGLVYLTVG